MEIRNGSPADIDAVLTFWRSAAREPSTTDDSESLGGLLASSPEALFLAIDGDEIVGTVIATWDGWRGSMYRLTVSPRHRRKGVATSLVRAGECCLRAAGAKRLHMIVSTDDRAAPAFWRAVGYTTTGQDRYVKTLD